MTTVLLSYLSLLAFDSTQSALNPGGSQAKDSAQLWWLFFWVLLAILVIVLLLLLVAFIRRGRNEEEPFQRPAPEGERRITSIVTGAVVLTILILFFLLVRDFFAGNKVNGLSEKDALEIKLTGHQWWWEVQYVDPLPSNMITTANEIHIPIGRVVKFDLSSVDVIHSFWVPNLRGKRDLIPGHPTTALLRADKAGEYHGQCAEFFGYQHAHMRMLIVAQPPKEFAAWLDAQRNDAPPPATPSARLGQQVFLSSQCVMCHAIAGTNARATTGPDLSHIGSHKTLAAGSFPNTRGYLAGWIANPQSMKPGVLMPPNALAPEQLNALIDYLEGLK